MSFEKKLQSLRKASNISQEELANELGVSRQAVSKWESGVSYPEMDKLILMTKIFNCTLDDLVNDDVTDSSIMKQDNNKGQNYIDSLLEFITKTINMFTSMKFNSVMKCLIELFFIVCLLYLFTTGIYLIIKELAYSMFPVSYGTTAYYILYFIGSVFLFLLVALDVVIFFQFYKIRYLDYYDKLIYQYRQEKKSEIESEKEDVIEEKKEKREVVSKEKRETIIIRDPDHRPLAFLSVISNAIIVMVKAFVFCFSFPFIFSLIGLIIGIVLSVYLIFTNFVFFGVTLALVGAIVINVELLIVLYDFIFNKKIFIKCLFFIFIASIFVSSIGVGMSLISLKNIDFVEVNQEQIRNVKETYSYNEGLYFNLFNYNNVVKYVVDNSLKDDVNVEVEYYDNYYDIDFVFEDDEISLAYNYSSNLGTKEVIDKVLKDLKNNRVELYYYGNYYNMISISSSEDNIKNLIKNVSSKNNIRIKKGKENGKVVYNVYHIGTLDEGTRTCELNDFYYNCVNVEIAYEIEPNFKYEYKNGTLSYDEEKYVCEYYTDDRTYSCSLRY